MKKIKRLIAPLKILRIEKIYFVWLCFVLAFGIINLLAGFLLGDNKLVDDAIQSGLLYTFSISLCAPFCADILIGFQVDKKTNKTSEFVKYKIPTGAFNIIWIFLLLLLWIGTYRSNSIIQSICFLISLLLALYMYCTEKMDLHSKGFEQEKDIPYDYLQDENNRQMELKDKAETISMITTNDGEGDIEI